MMRTPTLVASLVGTALSLSTFAAGAHAQPPYRPGPDPRAYRHFLLSRSPYKVYSTGTPGYGTVTETPFSYHSAAVGPGYLSQSVSHRGFEEVRVLPSYTERFESPFYGNYLYVPPQVRQTYLPPPPPPPPPPPFPR